MPSYEETVAKELRLWQRQMLKKPSAANRLAKATQTWINNLIPEKIHEIITTTIKQMTRGVLFGAEFITPLPAPAVSFEQQEDDVRRRISFYKTAGAAEGGVAGRGKRYRDNAKVLIYGMRAMGFRTLLPNELQAPIIITFHMPTDRKFVFQRFYDGLKDRGYVIYPGKLTVADSFRMGCIGRLYPEQMKGALAAVREVLDEMRVTNGGPALAAE